MTSSNINSKVTLSALKFIGSNDKVSLCFADHNERPGYVPNTSRKRSLDAYHLEKRVQRLPQETTRSKNDGASRNVDAGPRANKLQVIQLLAARRLRREVKTPN